VIAVPAETVSTSVLGARAGTAPVAIRVTEENPNRSNKDEPMSNTPPGAVPALGARSSTRWLGAHAELPGPMSNRGTVSEKLPPAAPWTPNASI
jgi:hypothetical protein